MDVLLRSYFWKEKCRELFFVVVVVDEVGLVRLAVPRLEHSVAGNIFVVKK